MKKALPTVSFFNVLKNAKDVLKNPLPFHHNNFKRLGDTFKVKLGFGNYFIFTRDIDFANHILKTNHKNYHKSPTQSKDLGKYIGNGLLTANGEYWLQQRRLIQPAFYKKKLEGVAKIITAVISHELKKIESNTTVNIHTITNNLAFKIVGKALFNYTGDNDTMYRLQEIMEQVQINLIKEIRQPYKKWWFILNGNIKHTKALSKEARTILQDFIEERQQSNDSHNDLLDLLLNSTYEDGSSMNMEQLIDEIIILFIAGHETTSNALAFAVMLLSKHPKIQEKIYTEVSTLSFENLSIMDSFKTCNYTKQCLEETMRLYPPAYIVDRIPIKNDDFNGVTYPKGATILISYYEIHRNKEAWKNPEDFIPERFNSNLKKEHSNTYFPFGAGPRMCVGSNFAIYEMIVTISKLIQEYQIFPEFDTIELKPLITLQPKNALVRFKKRSK